MICVDKDEKMWRWETDICEDEKVWRWETDICVDVKIVRCEDEKMNMCRCEDEKMMYSPRLLEEPFAQTLSGKNMENHHLIAG